MTQIVYLAEVHGFEQKKCMSCKGVRPQQKRDVQSMTQTVSLAEAHDLEQKIVSLGKA